MKDYIIFPFMDGPRGWISEMYASWDATDSNILFGYFEEGRWSRLDHWFRMQDGELLAQNSYDPTAKSTKAKWVKPTINQIGKVYMFTGSEFRGREISYCVVLGKREDLERVICIIVELGRDDGLEAIKAACEITGI